MKAKIKSAVLCMCLTVVSLIAMRYGNDGAHIPALDYTESAKAVLYMIDENELYTSAISYYSANNIVYFQKNTAVSSSPDTQAYAEKPFEVLPPVVKPPQDGIEVFGENN